MSAFPETERPLGDGSTWYWFDDNGKELELLAATAQPGEMDEKKKMRAEIASFIMQGSPPPFIFRRSVIPMFKEIEVGDADLCSSCLVPSALHTQAECAKLGQGAERDTVISFLASKGVGSVKDLQAMQSIDLGKKCRSLDPHFRGEPGEGRQDFVRPGPLPASQLGGGNLFRL